MSVAEELIAHIRDTVVPDKKRILRTRHLARELAQGLTDPAAAKLNAQRLNNAYLLLQLATLSDDPVTAQACRAECVALVRAIERASAGALAHQNPAPAPVGRRAQR